MGRQGGQVLITGNFSDLNFYEDPTHGHLIRKRSRLTAEKVETDEAFTQFRKSGELFTEAITLAKLFRNAIRPVLFPVADSTLSSRMNAAIREILQQAIDAQTSDQAIASPLFEKLKGLEFNTQATLADSLMADHTYSIDEATRTTNIVIPPFDPTVLVTPPPLAHSFQVFAATAMVNFQQKRYIGSSDHSPLLLLQQPLSETTHLTLATEPLAGAHHFVLLGIVFYGQLDHIPREAMSQRKRMKLKPMTDDEGTVRFTGSMKIVHASGPINHQQPL